MTPSEKLHQETAEVKERPTTPPLNEKHDVTRQEIRDPLRPREQATTLPEKGHSESAHAAATVDEIDRDIKPIKTSGPQRTWDQLNAPEKKQSESAHAASTVDADDEHHKMVTGIHELMPDTFQQHVLDEKRCPGSRRSGLQQHNILHCYEL